MSGAIYRPETPIDDYLLRVQGLVSSRSMEAIVLMSMLGMDQLTLTRTLSYAEAEEQFYNPRTRYFVERFGGSEQVIDLFGYQQAIDDLVETVGEEGARSSVLEHVRLCVDVLSSKLSAIDGAPCSETTRVGNDPVENVFVRIEGQWGPFSPDLLCFAGIVGMQYLASNHREVDLDGYGNEHTFELFQKLGCSAGVCTLFKKCCVQSGRKEDLERLAAEVMSIARASIHEFRASD